MGIIGSTFTWLLAPSWMEHAPSFVSQDSSYQKLLRETKARKHLPDVYVPPWRRTMSEVYGKEAVKKLHQSESYAHRAQRLAKEEGIRRSTPVSRAEMLANLVE